MWVDESTPQVNKTSAKGNVSSVKVIYLYYLSRKCQSDHLVVIFYLLTVKRDSAFKIWPQTIGCQQYFWITVSVCHFMVFVVLVIISY